MTLVSFCGLGYFWWMLASMEPFCYYFSFTQKRFFKVHKNVNVKFDDIIGLQDIKEEIKETMKTNFGNKMSKGYCFVGPPGTGKTMMAKAIATEIDVPFIEVSTNDISSSYIPTVLTTISKNYSRAIILMDECDSIVDRFSNTLLRQLDGMSSFNNIMFILTSNKEPAKNIIRSGRIDRIIYFNLPSYQDRIEILGKLGIDDTEKIAKMTDGFSHADLIKFNSELINNPSKDIAPIINLINHGMETCNPNVSEKERPRLIYHEIGHCIISHAIREFNKPNIVTINRLKNMVGHTNFDITDNVMLTRSDLLKRIGTLLASSVFEEFYLKEHSTSCSDDFNKINGIFDLMESCHMLIPTYPTKTDKRVIKHKILTVLRNNISNFIKDHSEVIHDMYNELNTKGTLYQESIDKLLAGRISYTIDVSSIDFTSQ